MKAALCIRVNAPQVVTSCCAQVLNVHHRAMPEWPKDATTPESSGVRAAAMHPRSALLSGDAVQFRQVKKSKAERKAKREARRQARKAKRAARKAKRSQQQPAQ